LLFAGCADEPAPVRAVRIAIQPLVSQSAAVPPGDLKEPTGEAQGCALLLELTDESTGNPVSADLYLYRLDVPADERWTQGDVLERELAHGRQPCWVRNLPAGRYRIRVTEQRDGSVDPPSFLVAGPETRIRLALPMPRWFRASLLVVNERGERLRRGRRRFDSYRCGRVVDPTPWLRLRQPRHGDHQSEEREQSIGHGDGDFSWIELIAPVGVFEMMRWREPCQGEWSRSGTVWNFEGTTPVIVVEKYDASRDVTYLALSVDPRPTRDAVRLPDGSAAQAAGAKIEIECRAVLLDATPDPERWRTVELSVGVVLAGYRRLQFQTTLGASARSRTLEPLSPK